MSIANRVILAGDIGGTKTLLGLFEHATPRPRAIETRSFGTLDYPDLTDMIAEFVGARSAHLRIAAACLGVAGPVLGETANVTNVPWTVDASQVARRFAIPAVSLLNDLEAMGYGVLVLEPHELHVLQEGRPRRDGNMALIAAGTGLGEALLHNVNGRLVPSPTEAGHADFSARTDREIALLRAIRDKFGRADVEAVVSGRGFFNIHPIAHVGRPCTAGIDLGHADAPAAITRAGLDGSCAGCAETVDLFVEAYGAEAGNLALRSVATGGVYVGGGIAPKILPALTNGTFMRAFVAKPPLEALLAAVPVKVILNAEAGLVGAAVKLTR